MSHSLLVSTFRLKGVVPSNFQEWGKRIEIYASFPTGLVNKSIRHTLDGKESEQNPMFVLTCEHVFQVFLNW